jgi:hypothetical protein
MNFGAGHGGISHLLWLNGHTVFNIEPSGLRLQYDQRWQTFLSIDDFDEEVDIIYGSHSLEHVLDLGKFETITKKLLRNGGYIFFEVPNGEHPLMGGRSGEIQPPHTFYFTRKYFSQLSFSTIINNSYCEDVFPNAESEGDSGEVIRYLGKINMSS